jgi:DNA-binding response OmpR family regulator
MELLHDSLLGAGYTQVVGVAGREAQRLLGWVQPALILLDIHEAPPSLGWQQLEALRSDVATAHTPIVITTTNPTLFHDRCAWLNDRLCTVLVLPFALDELLTVVQACIGAPMSDGTCAV